MVVRVAIAQTAEDLDDLFRVRHEVFCGGGYMPPHPDGRIVERFDAYPGALNIVAKSDDRVIGGMRLDLPSSCGVGADDFYDYGPALQEPATTGGVSAICLLAAYRGVQGVHTTMWKMLAYTAALKGLTHLRGSANPERVHLYESLGWRPISAQFHHDESGLDVVPMTLNLVDAAESLRGFIDHQELSGFEEVFERGFYAAGERVIEAGDVGTEAYLIVDGMARVSLPVGNVTFERRMGDLFGELALLSGRPRTASVDAVTDLEVMVLRREQLLDQLGARPQQTLRLLAAVSGRLADELQTATSAAGDLTVLDDRSR